MDQKYESEYHNKGVNYQQVQAAQLDAAAIAENKK